VKPPTRIVAQRLVDHRLGPVASADHRDRRGREDVSKADFVGRSFSCGNGGAGFPFCRKIDDLARSARFEVNLLGATEVAQGPQGEEVLAEYIGFESMNSVSPGHVRQVLQQQCADALMLTVVDHQ
jgi:hypothetical protein